MAMSPQAIVFGIQSIMRLGNAGRRAYQDKAIDPVGLTGVSVALFLVACVAAYLPARRGMRIDPMVRIPRSPGLPNGDRQGTRGSGPGSDPLRPDA